MPTTIKTHKNTSQCTVWSCNWWQRSNSQCWENVFGANQHSLRHRPCPASGSNRSGSGPPSWLSVNTQSYTSNLFGCVTSVTCSFLIESKKKDTVTHIYSLCVSMDYISVYHLQSCCHFLCENGANTEEYQWHCDGCLVETVRCLEKVGLSQLWGQWLYFCWNMWWEHFQAVKFLPLLPRVAYDFTNAEPADSLPFVSPLT